MRLSKPMPAATSFTSAPSASQMLAISLMKQILVARKALQAYLIISAVRRSVTTIGVRSGRCSCATRLAASRSRLPSTMRSGFIKSVMAEPSRRNSGHETTLNGTGVFCLRLDDVGHPVAGAHRHGGLVDDDERVIHHFGHGLGGGAHVLQVGLAVHVRGCADGNEDELGILDAFCVRRGEREPSGLDVARDHLFQPRLVNGQDALA